jgi:Uma2 family endonuclease
MTAHPLPEHSQPTTRPLTIAEYAALGEDEHGRTELQEGSLVMSPSPTPDHNVVAMQIAVQLMPQMPEGYEVIHDIDIDLQLVPPDEPGTARRPDLVVVDASARQRVRDEGGIVRASEVLVAVEIVSPGSRRTDNVVKRAEYADAGIRYYWIVDIDPPISLVACHRTEEFGYREDGAATGAFTTDEPFAVSLDLDGLR